MCVRMCLCGSRSLCSSLKLYFPSRPTGLPSEQGEPGEMRVLCGAETTDTGLQLRGHHRQFFRRLSGKTPLINLRADVQGLRDKHFLNFPCTYPSEIQFPMCPLKTIFYLLGVWGFIRFPSTWCRRKSWIYGSDLFVITISCITRFQVKQTEKK